MADLKNELVWSHSRARLFHKCLRAYWFCYYGSWGGWDSRAAPATRDAYVQKKLSSRPLWIGTRVHKVAEQALKSLEHNEPVPEAAALRRVRRDLAEDLRGSASGRWLERPSRKVGFREHYYQEPVPEGGWEEAAAEIERQVRGLYAHRIFRRLHDVPERIREVEELRRFAVGDAEIYVALDVLVADGRGGVVIIDWKTGDNHDDREIGGQLGVYGLYATQQLGVPPDRVSAMHVNTRSGTETRHVVGIPEIQRAEEEIRAGVAAMRSRVYDPAANLAKIEDHPPRPEGDPECASCNFRGVCGRAAPPRPASAPVTPAA